MTKLTELAVGDKAIVTSRARTSEVIVTKVTKTQIVTGDGHRYSRQHGRRIGDSSTYFPDVLHPADDEFALAKLAKEKRAWRIRTARDALDQLSAAARDFLHDEDKVPSAKDIELARAAVETLAQMSQEEPAVAD